jgi:hypothetical protein
MGTPLIQVESPRQWPLRTLFHRHFEEAVMSKGQPSDGARGNRLLGAMEAASRARIAPHLEPLVLKLGDVVCEAGGVLKHAYFPQSAVLSLLTVLENGSAIERPLTSDAKAPSACSPRCIAGFPSTDAWFNSRAV